MTFNYTAIGIKTDFLRNTLAGKSVYSVYFAEANGHIQGPFTVYGHLLDAWKVRHGQNYGEKWQIHTHTTMNRKEVIDDIKKEL